MITQTTADHTEETSETKYERRKIRKSNHITVFMERVDRIELK